MAVEKITLNLIPTGETPTIHAAQFDKERAFQIELKEGEDDFSPTGYTIEIQVRKVDNNIVTAVPSQVSGNIVTFLTTEQMTACSGTNLAELQISKDNKSIATLHFYLVVQRDVLAGGITSDSAIHNLTEQIAEIVPEVIGDDYYNKTEVDELIAEHTFDPTNYYDKSETDALLNDKADVSDLPDMTNYYTKSETYNKTEVDTALSGKMNVIETKSVSGAICSFNDGGDNIPVKSLVSEIVAVQDLHGYDKPWAEGAGKNKLNYDAWKTTPIERGTAVFENNGVTITATGNDAFTKWNTAEYPVNARVPISEGETITLSWEETTNKSGQIYIFPNGLVSGMVSVNNGEAKKVTYTARSGITFITFRFGVANSGDTIAYKNIQIEKGSQATSWEPYSNICPITGFDSGVVTVTDNDQITNTYTFAFGQTAYGGHFDNKGNLVVTHGFIASYNGETINEPWISSMDNYVPNTSPSIGAQVKYPLTTPITLQITSQDIPTLLGENNIYSDCGDTALTYFTNSADDIAELIKAFI